MDVPVELSRILITEFGEQQVIFLKETGGERTFPIMIGIAEALAIDRRLKGKQTPRPMTHDLLADVIDKLDARIQKVVISDIQDHTFIATLYLQRDGEVIPIDARPSDAIALCSAFDTPLFVAEHVFESVLNKEPTSKEVRIELLRRRMEMLAERIEEGAARLEDEDFLSAAPNELVDQLRRQLEEMRTEHAAIDEVLRRLG